jgi:uncharacterized OsmC-like protein
LDPGSGSPEGIVTLNKWDEIIVDTDTQVKIKTQGEDQGPRPKPLMLSALGGCTAMDVVAILKKMRVRFDSLNVVVEGDLTSEIKILES